MTVGLSRYPLFFICVIYISSIITMSIPMWQRVSIDMLFAKQIIVNGVTVVYKHDVYTLCMDFVESQYI